METKEISSITLAHRRQRRLEIIPRILSVILVVVAVLKIIISVYFLVGCRNKLRYASNAVGLHEAPCYHLVTPSYIGCAVLFITVFGLCCLGKKITAILFFILAVCGAGFCVYLFLCSNCSFNQREINELLNMTIVECNMQKIEDKLEVRNSWQLVKSSHPTCSKTADWIINTCGYSSSSDTQRADNSITIDELGLGSCGSSLYHNINDTQDHYMQFVLAIVLIGSVYYLFVSVVLCYIHQQLVHFAHSLTHDGEVLEELNITTDKQGSIKKYPKKFKLKLKWHFPHLYKNSQLTSQAEEI